MRRVIVLGRSPEKAGGARKKRSRSNYSSGHLQSQSMQISKRVAPYLGAEVLKAEGEECHDIHGRHARGVGHIHEYHCHCVGKDVLQRKLIK